MGGQREPSGTNVALLIGVVSEDCTSIVGVVRLGSFDTERMDADAELDVGFSTAQTNVRSAFEITLMNVASEFDRGDVALGSVCVSPSSGRFVGSIGAISWESASLSALRTPIATAILNIALVIVR